MSTKSSLCVKPGGKMDWGEKESIGSPFMCQWVGMRRVYCGEWLEAPPPAFADWPSVWGGNWSLSVGFVATAGVIAGIWPLAGIAVKAVTTCELRIMPAHIQYVHTQTGARYHTHRQECVQSPTNTHKQMITCTNTQAHTKLHTMWRYAI